MSVLYRVWPCLWSVAQRQSRTHAMLIMHISCHAYAHIHTISGGVGGGGKQRWRRRRLWRPRLWLSSPVGGRGGSGHGGGGGGSGGDRVVCLCQSRDVREIIRASRRSHGSVQLPRPRAIGAVEVFLGSTQDRDSEGLCGNAGETSLEANFPSRTPYGDRRSPRRLCWFNTHLLLQPLLT